MPTRLVSALTIVVLTGATLFAVGTTAAEAHETTAEHCISLTAIDRAEPVSDYGILFYMRNDLIYLNKLPHRCPGLAFEDSFMYRTSIGQLCDVDIISVLDDMGFGFIPGVSCGLGAFYPVTATEAEAIKSGEAADH